MESFIRLTITSLATKPEDYLSRTNEESRWHQNTRFKKRQEEKVEFWKVKFEEFAEVKLASPDASSATDQ